VSIGCTFQFTLQVRKSSYIYIYSLSHRRNLQEHELWNMSTEMINKVKLQ